MRQLKIEKANRVTSATALYEIEYNSNRSLLYN
jgi:hypothetical protein